MKKIVALLLCIVMLTTVHGILAETSQEKTATSTVKGFNGGDLTVSLTVKGNVLQNVEVQGDSESLTVGSVPVEVLPERMIAENNLEVDIVSGATITSVLIKNAAKDSLKQLGLSNDDLEHVTIDNPTSYEPVTTDVLVIGGGGAGITAALAARKAGKEVVLIEKLGILGGNTALSGGVFTRAAQPGDPDDAMQAADLTAIFKEATLGKANDRVIETYVERSVDVFNWVFSMGSGVPETQYFTVKPPNIQAIQAKDGSNVGGRVLMNGVIEEVKSSGTHIFVETTAKELLMENGAVVGVKAVDRRGVERTFYANNGVVLATGGFPAGKELLAKYSLPGAEKANTRTSVGTVGDGILMGEQIGADIKFGEDWDSIGAPFEAKNPMKSLPQDVIKKSILIDNEGKRFIAEDAQYPHIYKTQLHMIADGSTAFYCINDSTTAPDSIEQYLQRGAAIKADSIEDLAALINVPKDTLVNTVEEYNKLGTNDTTFNKQETYMTGIIEAPFYAYPAWPTRTTTIGGLVIDEKAQVLDKSGNPIAGLYAGGEVANYSFFYNNYATCGSAVGHAMIFGTIAGESASQFIRK